MKKLAMILPLVLILCLAVDCQDKEPMAELEAMRIQTKVEENNISITKRWLEEMDKGNLAIFDEICTEDYKCHFPWNPKPLDRDVHKRIIEGNIAAFPDYNHTVEDIIAQGDRVVVRITNRGTHKGKFDGIPPTGKEIEFSVISITRFIDGKVAEMWAEFDSLDLYQQLGRELKPLEGEK